MQVSIYITNQGLLIITYVSKVIRLWSIASWTDVTLGRGKAVAPFAVIESSSSTSLVAVSLLGVASSVGTAGGREII